MQLIIIYMQKSSLKVWKPKTPMQFINSAVNTLIAICIRKLMSLWRHFFLDPALSRS